jgi:small subunit ribosomal protein S6
MVNRYETVFIMTPVLSEPQMKETVNKFRDLLVKHSAKVVHEEEWGLKKLAYPIQKKSSGFYQVLEFDADSQIIAEFETELIHDERVIRFLTVKLDKHAVIYNEKKRNAKKETAKVENN